MLTRVYGTAFFSKKELEAELERLEEARARDHRKLGPQLGLFQFSEVSPGSTFWLPKGTALFNRLVNLTREMGAERGFTEVKTPLLYDSELWKTSGHWGKYRENMFITETEGREFGLKPMNCPGHAHLFGHAAVELPRSARALRRAGAAAPQRAQRHAPRPAASAPLHPGRRPHLLHRRADRAGGAHLPRVLVRDLRASSASRSSSSSRRAPSNGSAATRCGTRQRARWPRVLDEDGLDYVVNEGDGAFYGPKIDLHTTDSLGRSWQLGTVQLDYSTPERFGLTYTGADNADHRPVMIHTRPDGLLRALHRHPRRALRGRIPGLARAGPGDRAADRRPSLWRPRTPPPSSCAPAARASRSTSGRSRSGARSATRSFRRSRTCS